MMSFTSIFLLCFTSLLHFGVIDVQCAVHIRQVSPWPPLAERGGVVREGVSLTLQCESDEEPEPGVTIYAKLQVPGQKEIVCVTNCNADPECNGHLRIDDSSLVTRSSNRVWTFTFPIHDTHDGYALRCEYKDKANISRFSNSIAIAVTVMKNMSVAFDDDISQGVGRSQTPFPVNPVDVWSTDVRGRSSQNVQFTCTFRPKTAAPTPPVVHWELAPPDLAAIYGALGEKVPADAPTMRAPIKSTTTASIADSETTDSDTGLWKARIEYERSPAKAGSVRCSHLSSPAELGDSLNKTVYVHYGYESLLNNSSALQVSALHTGSLFARNAVLSCSSPAATFPPLALHWESLIPIDITENQWGQWEPVLANNTGMKSDVTRASDAFGGSSVRSNLSLTLDSEMAGVKVRCVLSNPQFGLRFISQPRTIDHSVLLGDSPIASNVFNASFTLQSGVTLHLSLSADNQLLTIGAYYSHQPYRLLQNFSTFPKDTFRVGHAPVNFSPSVAHMFVILQQLASAENDTMFNVSDTGEITARFRMFGGADALLTISVTRELLKDEEMYEFVDRRMQGLQQTIEELKAKLSPLEAAQEYRNFTDWSFESLDNASLAIVNTRVSIARASSSPALECAVGSRGLPSWGRHQWTIRVSSSAADGSSGVQIGVYIGGATYMLMEDRHSFLLLNCSSGRVLSRGIWGNDTGLRCGANSNLIVRVDADRGTLSFSVAAGSNLSGSAGSSATRSEEVGIPVSSIEMEHVVPVVCLTARTDSVSVL